VTAVLPHWPAGTVTILATAGDSPHAIPVSAAVRSGPRHALIGLAGGRGSLERLRADPRVSLTIVAQDIAVTAHGRARVLDDPLVEGVAAVEIEVEDVQDHDRPTFAIEAGVRWRWTDAEAERRDAEVRTRLLTSRATGRPGSEPTGPGSGPTGRGVGPPGAEWAHRARSGPTGRGASRRRRAMSHRPVSRAAAAPTPPDRGLSVLRA
jgi:hypothetical protein